MLLTGHDINYICFHFYNFPPVPSSVFVIYEAKLCIKCSALELSNDRKTIGLWETAPLMNAAAEK